MADQVNIPTTGIWSTIANAINTNFTSLFRRTGWASYSDTQYTAVSPFVVSEGATVALPNNAGNIINSQIPAGVTTFYDGQRIRCANNGDAYVIRVDFDISSDAINGAYAVTIDISAAGDGSFIISNRAYSTIRGANTPQGRSITSLVYSLDTFLANGALVRMEAISGNLSVYGISYQIARIHEAY